MNNPIRRVGLNLAMVFLFFRFTGLHEVAAAKFGFNSYVLYVFGAPAILCLLLSDGLARTVQSRQAKYWLGFVFCLVASVPFSDWRGGSLKLVVGYLRTEFVVLFLIAGLVMTWRECWRLLGMLSIASVIVILLGQFFKAETMGADDRLEIASGLTMGNSNDYAALLALLLPFLGLVLVTPGRAIVLRIIALSGLLFGLYLILSTGSRGAEVAILVTLAVIVYKLPPLKRIGIGVAALTVGAMMLLLLPGTITQRLATLVWSQDNAVQTEATYSGESRWYLLQKSLLFTVQRPLFGVGPGEFADHEGFAAKAEGFHGNWHQTHNTYTQVSSEVGIPAAMLFIAALVSTYGLLSGTLKQARARPPSPQNTMIAAGVFCVLIGAVAFYCSAFFLSLAFKFHFPALTAIAIVLSRAAQHQWVVDQRHPSHRSC
ncbi:MAG: O-antigen ligase family protein [Acidobacteriia bacterium]|nr:O-antigen ligase family protein [Terriglobia bacterium]